MEPSFFKPLNPSFFKPLIQDFAEKLLIPQAFVKKYGEHYDANWVLKCEKSYKVEIEECDEGSYYIRNGWPVFASDHKLAVGDFIVFSLVERSVFEVTVFEPSMCEKHICDHPDQNSGDHTTENPIKVEETDTSSDSDHTKEPSPKKTKRPNLLHTDSEETYNHALTFKLIISEVHKTNLPLPSWFATKSGISEKEEIKLSGPKGKEYVAMISQGTDVELTGGWTKLYAANGLKKGDTCIFRCISGKSVDCIKVDIQRGRGRPSKVPKNKS